MKTNLLRVKRSVNISVVVCMFFTAAFIGAQDKRETPDAEKKMIRQITRELVTLPYYGVFDDLSFEIRGRTVILHGQVVRPTLKSSAEAVVKDVDGVETVVNQIEVLPTSPNDDRIRLAVYRALYTDVNLSRYGLRAVPPIHIIVKNGQVVLTGVVATTMDSNVANIRAREVPGAFGVTNNLRIESEENNNAKGGKQ